MRRLSPALILLAFTQLPSVAKADPQPALRGQDRGSQFMRVYGPTLPPFGYLRFCERFPRECRRGAFEEARFGATADRMAELDTINRHVNKVIEPATDLEIYGETEVWTLPTTRGDCEDYVLLKRQMLMARGWPASALLITVVRDEKGEGHAILTARTAQGDFILDNKTDVIQPWSKTAGYSYVMRQSYIDPNVWVSLDPKDSQSPALLAGMRQPR
jgi:predicted transglutaminase-like cysteine proteinase